MRTFFLFFLITSVIACKSSDEPQPGTNPYLKISENDFIGTWVYKIDGQEYAKIIISLSGDGLEFERSEMTPTGWKIDSEEYFPQAGVKFYPYLTTTINNKPHIFINSFHGSVRIDYVNDSQGIYLHLGAQGRYFKN